MNKYTKVSQKFEKIVKILATNLIERDLSLKLSILCALTGESIFLLGLPGIGKSLIARKIANIFRGASQFEILMSKYTGPDEVFGPINILDLKDGNYNRKVDNFLPKANIAFLDEIWKSSSSIQNSLLTIINEKIFYNNGKPMKVDLVLLLAASNETPVRDEGLEALWDRFIIRVNLESIEDDNEFIKMISNQRNLLELDELDDSTRISYDEIKTLSENAKLIKLNEIAQQFILDFKIEIEKYNVKVLRLNPFADSFDKLYVSDRKWKKIVSLLQMMSILNGRDEIHISDFVILEYSVWNTPEQINDIKKMILRTFLKIEQTPIYENIEKVYDDFKQELFSISTEKRIEKREILKPFINNTNSYYRFVDKVNKEVIYFLANEIDSIPQNKESIKLNWLISTISEEEFNQNLVSKNKELITINKNKYFMYPNQDETVDAISLTTEFEMKEEIKFKTIVPNAAKLAVIKTEIDKFTKSLEIQIKNYENEKNEIKKGNINLFFNSFWIKNRIEYLDEMILSLNNIINIVVKLKEYSFKEKVGFDVTSVDQLFTKINLIN